MVKKKQANARIARKKTKTAVEEHFEEEGMVTDNLAATSEGKETEEIVDAEEVEALEAFQNDEAGLPEIIDKDEDLDIFKDQNELVELGSTDILMAVKESSKKKKDVSEFLPEELKNIDLRQEVTQLVRDISSDQFRLGKLLYYIDVNETYREWGYKSLDAYLNNEGGTRRLKYLAQLHKWLVTEVKDKNKIEAIQSLGWSKAKEVQRVASNPGALDMWIDSATKMNLLDLTDAVKLEIEQQRVNAANRPVDEVPDRKESNADAIADSSKEKLSMWNCKLQPEELVLVHRAMVVASKETKTKLEGSNAAVYIAQGKNLAWISQEFLMDADLNTGNRLDNIKKYLKKIEERFDIKLVAVDNKADKVFFGSDLLDGGF